MSKNSLKFFQSYVYEMADIGGENLPKTVSTKLGTKLGRLYKQRNPDAKLEKNLKKIYTILGAKPNIRKLNDNTLEVTVKHRKKFCPIGGDFNVKRAEFVNNNICIPYTLGFLHELEPNMKFEADIQSCIVSKNTKICEYILKMEPKNR
ncbi:MAG: hypothetical protein EU529_09405 [Promethearchaeota archaeon]|nr:MAG: hypothetical protein EU529_09405 [Candidatus Lokiarchaeota archaeon]